MKLINIERLQSCVFGGLPSNYDRCIVISETETENHVITKELQPKQLFSGTMDECYAYMKKHETSLGALK